MNFNLEKLQEIREELKPMNAELIAVSKTKPAELISEVYHAGQIAFGENYVQELIRKKDQLPQDIRWHFIGHLQSNKVKGIASFVSLVQSVDSLKLLQAIDEAGKRNGRIIPCLLQVHIASEETKFGLSMDETKQLLDDPVIAMMKNCSIKGLMGMATATSEEEIIRKEFRGLRNFFDQLRMRKDILPSEFNTLSMGMTSDYKIALEEGSTLVRIGSAIFGERTPA